MSGLRIAVLALQGAFAEHEQALANLGVSAFELRQRRDLERSFDGLILPGGESTVQGKLLRETGLFNPLQTRIASGLPVFGTCAGLLLLAGRIQNDERTHFATMDTVAVRNAYGRQLGSFATVGTCKGIGQIPMTFIRAPYLASVSGDAEALAEVDGHVVAARQGKQLVTAFHPELTSDLSVHEYFLRLIRAD